VHRVDGSDLHALETRLLTAEEPIPAGSTFLMKVRTGKQNQKLKLKRLYTNYTDLHEVRMDVTGGLSVANAMTGEKREYQAKAGKGV